MPEPPKLRGPHPPAPSPQGEGEERPLDLTEDLDAIRLWLRVKGESLLGQRVRDWWGRHPSWGPMPESLSRWPPTPVQLLARRCRGDLDKLPPVLLLLIESNIADWQEWKDLYE